MFIVFARNHDGPSHKFKAGGRYDLPSEQAAVYLANGLAREAGAVAPAPVETAAVAPQETSMKPPPEPPRRRPGRPPKRR